MFRCLVNKLAVRLVTSAEKRQTANTAKLSTLKVTTDIVTYPSPIAHVNP